MAPDDLTLSPSMEAPPSTRLEDGLLHDSSSLPRSSPRRWSRKARTLLAAGLGLLFLAGFISLLVFWTRGLGQEAFVGPTHTVQAEKLTVSIVERGTLESARNSDIVCLVKAKQQGGNASSIKWVIDDGTKVEKGQLLMLLDDGWLQDQIKVQSIEVDKAKADWVKAEEDYQIVLSQNFSDIEKAKIDVDIAELDLQKYLGGDVARDVLNLKEEKLRSLLGLKKNRKDQEHLEGDFLRTFKERLKGDFLQMFNDINGRIEIALSDREQWLDRAHWSRRMVKKGYVSRSQADSDEARLASAEISLKKVQGEMEILRRFTLPQEVTNRWSKVREFERALERMEIQAKSKEIQGNAERQAKKSVYMQQEAKKGEIKEEIHKCRVVSPQSGLVVYYVSEQSRFGGSSQQAMVAQGETVKEGQKLMRIPDLTKMQVNVRIHEAMVSRLRPEITRPTGFTDALEAAFLVDPHGLSRLASTLAFGEIREEFHAQDNEVVFAGQLARVRVDAYPNRTFRGHVKTVATVASQTDWLSSDVKVYQTIVSIDETVDNLRPGFSAEVTIFADETSDKVLTIPIQSVAGTIAMGAQRKCFVLNAQGQPEERDIVVGMSNIKMVEVSSGLQEGERVVLNPRQLLGDKSKLKVGIPGLSRGAEDEGTPKGKKSGKKWEGKKRDRNSPGPGFPGDSKNGNGLKGPFPGGEPGPQPQGEQRFTPEQMKAWQQKSPKGKRPDRGNGP